MKSILISSFCLLISNLLLSQSSLFDQVYELEDYEIFQQMLDATGIDEWLKNDDYYSVFAPSDVLFLEAFSQEEIDSLLENENEYLTDLMHNHLVKGSVVLDFDADYNTYYGSKINVFIDGAGARIVYGCFGNNGRVGPPEGIEASNGSLFLMSESIMNIFDENPANKYWQDFWDESIDALEYRDTLLNYPGPYTLIIPPIEEIYFSDFYQNDEYEDLALLDSFMSRHILDGHYGVRDFYDGLELETWGGEIIKVTEVNDSIRLNGVSILSQCTSSKGVVLFPDNYIEEEQSTSSPQLPFPQPVQIFPVPAKDQIHISSLESVEYLLDVYSAQGKCISKQLISGPEAMLGTGHLRSGIYFLHFKTQANRFIRKVIIEN